MVVLCLVGHQLDHLIVLLNCRCFLVVHHLGLLDLHLLIFRLAIGNQDKVGERF